MYFVISLISIETNFVKFTLRVLFEIIDKASVKTYYYRVALIYQNLSLFEKPPHRQQL